MAESVLMCPKGGTNMTGEFSRRSFLKYTALTAVAVAGSSLLTGCSGYAPVQHAVGTSNKVLKDTIEGVEELHGTQHTVLPDMIEVGSFIGMAAMTKSEITIKNVSYENLGWYLHGW